MRSLGLASPAALARAPPDGRCLLSLESRSDWANPAVPRAAGLSPRPHARGPTAAATVYSSTLRPAVCHLSTIGHLTNVAVNIIITSSPSQSPPHRHRLECFWRVNASSSFK